ncbi:MAG: hypothetical protein JWN80_2835 [Microbacteriaceae bacterium]|nr:hypothetical protein [Microbacteriaceae bacterium]
MPAAERVIAVIPTFGPDGELVGRVRSLSRQVDSVIIVDDGSSAESAPVLAAIIEAGFEVVTSTHNRGIAAALNTGCSLALERGAAFVLTVDQDTELAEDYVQRSLSAFAAPHLGMRVGLVAADIINDAPSIPASYSETGLGIVLEAIQSGLLISRECLLECGLFDARLFIDAVDTEFCLRVADHGFTTVVVPGTRIIHALGEQLPYRPFGVQRMRDGRPVAFEYHRPFRRYYIVRNNLDLYLRYLRTRPRWVLSSVRREIDPTLKSLASGPDRSGAWLALLVGAAHGLVRRRGRLSPGLQRALTRSR